jgi:hypothetical protein
VADFESAANSSREAGDIVEPMDVRDDILARNAFHLAKWIVVLKVVRDHCG